MLRVNALFFAALSGCFSFEFPDPVRASFSATTDGSGVTLVEACISEGLFGFFCSDAGTSRVFASSDGEETILFPNTLFGVTFEGFLTGDASGKEIAFSWEGKDGRVFSDSVVTLPDAFNLIEPAQDSNFLSTDDVRVTWGPASPGGVILLDKSISCDDGSSLFASIGEFEDNGELIVPASELQFSPAADCLVELTLIRVREGSLDPELQPGSIEGRQSRTVSFFVNPK